jgi:hypothetical protein
MTRPGFEPRTSRERERDNRNKYVGHELRRQCHDIAGGDEKGEIYIHTKYFF